jgi:hypothetical protein
MTKTLLLLTTCLIVTEALADDAEEQNGITASLDGFFTAITAKDIPRMRELMTSEGIIHGYRDGPEGVQITARTHEQFIAGVRDNESILVERYWDPVFTIHDRMATALTPYDVYIDGRFSHCGVNHFSMLNSDAGWIVAGVVYSIFVEECEESPLGPFEGEGQP